jgi:hypothetical protein
MPGDASQSVGKDLSVVIPTYNRRDQVVEAIGSALRLVEHANIEVIVVDDRSSDDTLQRIEGRFEDELRSGIVRVVCNAKNLGVTGAKNVGAALASGEWIVFLDSDDQLLNGSLGAVLDELRAAKDVPMVFFRCVDTATDRLVGKLELEKLLIGFREILGRWKWGECLPAIRREAFNRFRYDEDLRGFEGLAYCRMTRALGAASLSTTVARMYSTVGHDRLSSRSGLKMRSCELALGYWRILQEFGSALGILGAATHLGKAYFYAGRCLKLKVRETVLWRLRRASEP